METKFGQIDAKIELGRLKNLKDHTVVKENGTRGHKFG